MVGLKPATDIPLVLPLEARINSSSLLKATVSDSISSNDTPVAAMRAPVKNKMMQLSNTSMLIRQCDRIRAACF
jgi:hypothetical protein